MTPKTSLRTKQPCQNMAWQLCKSYLHTCVEYFQGTKRYNSKTSPSLFKVNESYHRLIPVCNVCSFITKYDFSYIKQYNIFHSENITCLEISLLSLSTLKKRQDLRR